MASPRLRGHQLNRGQQPALAGIVGTKRDRALKDPRGFVEPLQPDEARAVRVQRVELRVEERAGLLEVADRRLALAVAVLEDGKHRVGGRIVGAQLEQMAERGTASRLPAWYCSCAAPSSAGM